MSAFANAEPTVFVLQLQNFVYPKLRFRDQPIIIQYASWLGRILIGDFGRSIQGGRPVFPLLIGIFSRREKNSASALPTAEVLA